LERGSFFAVYLKGIHAPAPGAACTTIRAPCHAGPPKGI